MTVRPIAPGEADLLQAIEDAADRALVELLRPDAWDGAPAGAERVAEPGFVLVAEEDGGEVVVHVHVLEVEGLAHLEQVAVLPEHGRRGHGRALVEAAKREAAQRGHARMTLRTYADVPFNAPLYASCGFAPSEPDSPFLRGLVEVEARHGLDRWGRRVQMTAALGSATQ